VLVLGGGVGGGGGGGGFWVEGWVGGVGCLGPGGGGFPGRGGRIRQTAPIDKKGVVSKISKFGAFASLGKKLFGGNFGFFVSLDLWGGGGLFFLGGRESWVFFHSNFVCRKRPPEVHLLRFGGGVWILSRGGHRQWKMDCRGTPG